MRTYRRRLYTVEPLPEQLLQLFARRCVKKLHIDAAGGDGESHAQRRERNRRGYLLPLLVCVVDSRVKSEEMVDEWCTVVGWLYV